MHLFGISVFVAIASLIAVSHGQCIRIRSGNGNGSQQPCSQQGQPCSSCGPSVEDLTTLLTIVKALEERETSRPAISNAEEIILQLVNALVYATTQKPTCPGGGVIGGTGTIGGTGVIGGTGGIGGTGVIGGTGGIGGSGGIGGTGGIGGNTGIVPPITNGEYPDDGLITLSLLQPGTDYEHLLRLGIAGRKILDLELGHDDGTGGAVSGLLNGLL